MSRKTVYVKNQSSNNVIKYYVVIIIVVIMIKDASREGELTIIRVRIRFAVHVLVYDTVHQAFNINISVHGGICQTSFSLEHMLC